MEKCTNLCITNVCRNVQRDFLDMFGEMYKVTFELDMFGEMYKVTCELDMFGEMYKVTCELDMFGEITNKRYL